ncbi:MAG: hypothetical protein LBT46_02510 [Planctomycetaceae bacterium]|nr:hypothetical protein [Planctomycetaceae bacterium]
MSAGTEKESEIVPVEIHIDTEAGRILSAKMDWKPNGAVYNWWQYTV